MTIQVRTEVLPENRPLLDLLPEAPDDERLVFTSGDDGLVGWGVTAQIAVGTGPGRFSRARDALHDLAGESGDPLVAFASFTFDADEDASVMVVPQIVVRRQKGMTSRMTFHLEGGADRHVNPDADTSGALTTARAAAEEAESVVGVDRPRYAGSTLRDDAWLEAVATALEAIERDEYEKVVLARDLHLWSRAPFDVARVLHDLAERFPSCTTFLVDHLLGASPEQLVRRSGRAVTSQVLAGTAPRGADASEDDALGSALLGAAKDRREHDLALRSAVEVLDGLCDTLSVPEAPSLVRLDNVQHLGSALSGTLSAQGGAVPHVLDLLGRLHPTAAVGGVPRTAALRAIGELEGMSRGRYAGPVGWCTSDGDGEFAIALRCAEIRGERARLFAGAGIVAGSLPEAELTETWLKLRAMTGVLGA